MKLLLPLTLLTALAGRAQLSVISPRLTDSSAAVFYIGADNPIEIKGMDNPVYYAVHISGGGSMITLVSVGRYVVRVTGPDSVTLSITRKNKLVWQRRYGTGRIPDPRVAVAGSLDSVIARSTILANPVLECITPGCLYRNGFRVTQFKMSMELSEEVIEMPSSSDAFTPRQLQELRGAPPGTMVIFEEISALCPDGRTRRLPPVIIHLK